MVGIDGSESSALALEWALEEARLCQSSLTAVYAWARPIAGGWVSIPSALIDPEELGRRAQERLDDAVLEIAGDPSDVEIDTVAQEGRPAEVLIAASKAAQLLVLGSRGHGGLAATVLGSVGNACVQHAHCPVVIVPLAAARP